MRLYGLTNPLADWHSFRQADTASVTREYVKHGIDLLHPRYQDLSNIQSGEENGGKDNVMGYRMVEFPMVNGVIAKIIQVFPALDLVITSRVFSIFASLVSLGLLMWLSRKLYDQATAVCVGLFFGFIPYSVYYSRVILPEPFVVLFMLASLCLFHRFAKQKKLLPLLLSGFCFALAVLLKPMAVFILPAFAALALAEFSFWGLLRLDMVAVMILSFIPLLLWRRWILQFPLGIPVSDWLYNGGDVSKKLSPLYMIRFTPAWWRWLFWERLTKLILGFTGIVFFGVGVGETIYNSYKNYKRYKSYIKKPDLFILFWGLGMFAYLAVFAAGNVQHDYYQVIVFPFVAFVAGRGLALLWTKNITIIKFITVITVILMMFLSWNQVKGYYQINHWAIIHAGQIADKILPADAKVIAPYQGDTAFLFQTNRTGWPIGFDIDKKISEGAAYYVSVNFDDETNALMKKYTVIAKTKEYVIIDLTKPL